MTTKRSIHQAMGLALVVLLLTGCGGVPVGPNATPTPIPIPLTPTSIPSKPAATMTKEATTTPKPAEVTPTPSQVPTLESQPGATFSGPIKISGKASSGAINFVVSVDGASIISMGVTLKDVKCDGMSAGSMETAASGPFPVTDGKFAASSSSLGEIKGQFTSSTEAVGTIHIRLEFSILGQTTVCELGTWDWSANSE